MVDDQYTIEILDISIDVIEAFLDSRESHLGPSELARKLGINRTRAFRILKTLERRGYVELVDEGASYRLGLKFLIIGNKVQESIDIRSKARPILKELAIETGDAAYLLVLYGSQAICVDYYQGQYLLQATPPFDRPLPLHIGASPKILLAFLPEDEREKLLQNLVLDPFTDKTITDHEELRRKLDQIKEKGYEVDEGDFETGVYAIGAPVFDHNRKVVAGVTLTIPANRYSEERRSQTIEMVISAADQISRNLGYIFKDEDLFSEKRFSSELPASV
jgi:IclR family transcriptional regulator, KDG regulon repressor